jgi:hypothetical protein
VAMEYGYIFCYLKEYFPQGDFALDREYLHIYVTSMPYVQTTTWFSLFLSFSISHFPHEEMMKRQIHRSQ